MERKELECRLYCTYHGYEVTCGIEIKSNGKKEKGVIYIDKNINRNFLEKLMKKCKHCSYFGIEINGRILKGNGNGRLNRYKIKLRD
jgi:hypothetical protein